MRSSFRRRMCVPTFAALVALGCAADAAAAKYTVKVVTDRKDAVYEAGQEARFQISVTKDGKPLSEGSVSYSVDDFLPRTSTSPFPSGRLTLGDKPVTVVATMKRPGFLRCIVVFTTPDKKRLQATAGAGFSPARIKPSLPVPDDFDAFWAAEKRKLAGVPATAKLKSVPFRNAKLECFDVQVPCTGGAPVSGYFARPKGAKRKSLPAVLWVHGAGVRGSSLSNAVRGAEVGMLSMDINAHGIPNGKPAAFYRELSAGKLRNYSHAGRKSRDTIYFRGMFLRLVRAIDFLTSQPEWDGKTVAVVGHSQGGGQALVAGGIDSRVTFIATGVPAICDHTGVSAGRVNGWPKLVPNTSNGKPDPAIAKAARYVDAVNFASRCKADAIMSVGYIDAVCPPSSCYAAFNVLKGKKQMLAEPLMGHAAPGHIQKAFFAAILAHAKR